MTNEEITRMIYRTLIEISEREKKKAIQGDDYSTALIATVFEALFREAEKSIEKKN